MPRRFEFFGAWIVLALLLGALPVGALARGAAPVSAESDPRVERVAARIDRIYDDVDWQVGEIVGIVDGDTADIRIGKRRLERLRLTEIDAPERGAPWSRRSTQLLSDLIFGEQVLIAITDWDRDGRAVARIFVWDGSGESLIDVSEAMIQQGAAWYFDRFGRDRSLLLAETGARKARAGLWSLPPRQQIPPWQWRKMPKEERDLYR
jgi:endonuclease YncB( thermonuclease family)